MKWILLLFFIPSLALADYNYLELGVGARLNYSEWVGEIPASIELGRHFDINDRFYIRGNLNHTSNLDKGDPLNDEYENHINALWIKMGIRF